MALCGVFFDVLVCYLCKGIDFYGDTDEVETADAKQTRDLSTIHEESSSKEQLS